VGVPDSDEAKAIAAARKSWERLQARSLAGRVGHVFRGFRSSCEYGWANYRQHLKFN